MQFSRKIFGIVGLKYISLLVILFLVACKNDLNIKAPYKEIPSVYAIITPQESMQMIRINKVFLGDGDANEMAKVADSVNYQAGELTVKLERFVNGTKVAAEKVGGKTEVLFRDSLIQTEPGAFSTTQRVYICNDRLFSDGLYKLTISNNNTGNVFTATTTAIDSVPLTGLPPFAPPYYPVPYSPSNTPSYYIDYSNVATSNPYVIRTKAVNGGFIHDLTLRLHYYDSIGGLGKQDQYLDYVFPPQQLNEQVSFNNTLYFNFTFRASNLFLEYGNMLSKRTNPSGFVGRRAYKMDYICYATTQDYYDYLQFAAPSLTFAQDKLLYSNFDNKAALGLFTFRSRCLISKELWSTFVDEFAVNKYTCQYQFYTFNLTKPGCQ
ncbi:MAG: hypothetical protein AB7O73_03140 [Bacteroidia bacterium]